MYRTHYVSLEKTDKVAKSPPAKPTLIIPGVSREASQE